MFTGANIFSFYAPMAGLMALSFWVGVLSQRVRHLESFGYMKVSNQVVEISTKQDAMDKKVDRLEQSMQGVQRQLGNLSMRQAGQVIELSPGKAHD